MRRPLPSLTLMLTLTASAFTGGCNTSPIDQGARKPSSTPAIQIPKDLTAATAQLVGYLQSPDFTPETCAPILNQIYEQVFNLDSAHFDRNKAIAEADTILKNLWESKLTLRKRMGGFLERGKLSTACVDASRNALRAGRYIEDTIGFLKLKGPKFDKNNVREAFSGGYPHLLGNAGKPKVTLKSGDILLSRGTAFTSAAIARIGDIDAQFSHLAMAYIDEKTKKQYTVEAHIEIGTKVFTIEEYLRDGKARAVLFRYRDSELAHQAAKRIYEAARTATSRGENIPYDFGMTMDEPSELFCSEIVQHAFNLAAKDLGREFRVPLFPTRISMQNRDFLEAIGVKATTTFAPADIEVDPRLEMVAEWRDYSRIRLLHQHDAILVKIYDWMERLDYRIQGDLFTWLSKHTAWTLRRWPLFSAFLKDKFPKNMSANTIGAVTKLNRLSEVLFAELEAADSAHYARTGLHMTPNQMETFLERLREADLKNYREHRACQSRPSAEMETSCGSVTPIFHLDFRARNEG
jgi:hypothetical protein